MKKSGSSNQLQFFIPFKDRSNTLKQHCLKCWSKSLDEKEILQALFKGSILVDGKKGKPNQIYKPGQSVELRTKKIKEVQPEQPRIRILKEDEHMLIAYKPAGLAVNGGRGQDMEGILGKFVKMPKGSRLPSGPTAVHRLDVPTSGLVVFAKSHDFLTAMSDLFKNRLIQKEYHAVVIGKPPHEGEMNTPIDEKESSTRFTRLKTITHRRIGEISLVQLFPKTGRTHQIRIHLQRLGHPIIGDDKYGTITSNQGPTLLLSAVGLDFVHPITKDRVHVQAKPPKAFEHMMNYHRQG